jgi:hypothetical protein
MPTFLSAESAKGSVRPRLLIALSAASFAAAACAPGSYSYGSGACASCAPGAAFSAATGLCAPAAAPSDTAFYLSGSQAEGVAAFASAPTAAYATSVFGEASGALVLGGGSNLTVAGESAPAAMPTGNSAWSASAWVKCAAPPAGTLVGVLAWGAPGGAQDALSAQTAALLVAGKDASFTSGLVTTFADMRGPNPAVPLESPSAIAIDSSGNLFVAASYRVRVITPGGLASTLAGPECTLMSTYWDCPYGFVNGQGSAVRFYSLSGIAVDSSGNIYVSDMFNSQIRKIAVIIHKESEQIRRETCTWQIAVTIAFAKSHLSALCQRFPAEVQRGRLTAQQQQHCFTSPMGLPLIHQEMSLQSSRNRR